MALVSLPSVPDDCSVVLLCGDAGTNFARLAGQMMLRVASTFDDIEAACLGWPSSRVVVADLSLVTMREVMALAVRARVAWVLLFSPQTMERVGELLALPDAVFLPVDDEPRAILAAAEELASPLPNSRVAEGPVVLGALPPDLAYLPSDRPGGSQPDPGGIRRELKLRRLRDHLFAPSLFADPAWDMLLDLTAAPAATALRWIKHMCESGLLTRSTSPHDRRVTLIDLSDEVFRRMCAFLVRAGTTTVAL
jgi:hypothetical protein